MDTTLEWIVLHGMICSEETREKMRKAHIGRLDRFPYLRHTLSKRPEWTNDLAKLKIATQKNSDKRRLYDIAKLDYNTKQILCVYKGMMEIKEVHPGYYRQAILSCCAGEKKSYKGFKWRYIDRKTNQIVNRGKHMI